MTKALIPNGGMPPGAEVWPRALQGDAAALASLAAGDASVVAWLTENKILGALACRAGELSLELPTAWRQHLQRAGAQGIVFESVLQRIAATLGAHGVTWCPLKGMDLRSRLYRWPEERAVGDVDVLVAPGDFEQARDVLRAAGWRDACKAEDARRYEREEGYNWQAFDGHGVLLELHFRLWGAIGEAFAEEARVSAWRDEALGPCGRRLSWPFAFVVAAVHCWIDPPPHAAREWWEVHLLSQQGGEEMVSQVVEIARRWGLELPVVQAAIVVCELWPGSPCGAIGNSLRPHLRWSERLVARRSLRRGADLLPWGKIVLARLLAGRPTRMGWRTPIRRVWDHAGTVAATTPDSWPWWRRRGFAIARNLGLLGGRRG
jgi:hypothetical protein